MSTNTYYLYATLIMFVVTFALRATSFIAFGTRPASPVIVYIGKTIGPAIIAALIVFCLRNVSFATFPFGLPEIIATAICIIFHIWKRNCLLSILISTLAYMIFIQKVFV